MQQAGREPGYNGDIHERDSDGLYLIAFGLVALAKNVRPCYLADGSAESAWQRGTNSGKTFSREKNVEARKEAVSSILHEEGTACRFSKRLIRPA